MSPDDIELIADELLDVLVDHDPVVSADDRSLFLTVSVVGSAAAAVPIAVSTVWDALEMVHANALHITGAWQVNENQIRKLTRSDEPIVLLNASDCARELEVSRQRVSQLIDAGDFPSPCGVIGSRPVWNPTDIRLFKLRRRRTRR
jgi:hypothetical protein